jgi:uncharacterized protein
MQQEKENTPALAIPEPLTRQPTGVWLLLDDRPGHATQVKGLAQKMGWRSHQLELRFNFWNRLPNPLLGKSLLSLGKEDCKKLLPPYPEIVVGMGRRIVPVARWIKQKSGGKTRIVLLGRKAVGKASDIDYVVSCVHFNQLPRERFFELVVPPTQVTAETLAATRQLQLNPISGMAHPRVVLLVGGPTAQHHFDEGDATRMVSQVLHASAKLDGSLAIVTSRRTPPEAVAAMRRIAPDAHIHAWNAGVKENPYLSYLAYADFLVVTGESESMIAEASASGLPLTIYPLRVKPLGMKNLIAGKIRWTANERHVLAKICRYLLLTGWIVPPRDLELMHTAMEKKGMARVFQGVLNIQKPAVSDELAMLANHLAKLVQG